MFNYQIKECKKKIKTKLLPVSQITKGECLVILIIQMT